MLDSLVELGKPILVFSGGEPLLRPDWQELAGRARTLGLPTALATNGTLVDADLAERIAAAGFARVSVSIDAPSAEKHDLFRGQAGAFAAAVAGIGHLRQAGVAVQINSTITAANADQLEQFSELARQLGAVALHLFVLVPVGCGLEVGKSDQLSPQQCDQVLARVCDLQAAGGLELKVTCAPQYARVARDWLAKHPADHGAANVRKMLRGKGCLAGTGVVFVSSAGEVFPCGYFPVSCGNIKLRSLPEIWGDSPVFSRLRDPAALSGNCGACDCQDVCGGCRARAYSASGDFMAGEPTCTRT